MSTSTTKIIKNNILTKPYLITVDELNSIGQNLNLVGYDPQLNLGSDDSIVTLLFGNSSSPKLLNWVEAYVIDGVNKTLFYTEVNSGFNIGDKLFIVNGTYDSNELIKKNKYKNGNDGYKVLYVDRCIVVLDINYTGLFPADETTIPSDKYDEFIKVYYVKDEKDFLLVNRQLTSGFTASLPLSSTDLKFNKNQNNFIYVDKAYSPISGWGECVTAPSIEGFYYRDGLNWIDVTTTLMSSNYTTLLSNVIETNYKITIINGSFTNNDVSFREGLVYIFNGITWEVSVKHENNNVPIITKSNFRDGYFNGKWNGGCYGTNVKRIKWNKNESIWNSGTLLNTQWKWGFINSLYTQKESFVSEFDDNNKPFQRVTNFDNDGYGYNFIINSELENYVINNGNLSNSILGTGSTISIVKDHLNGLINDAYISTNFDQSLVNKSVFDNCFIINGNIENSIVKDCRSENSRFLNVKSINSHFKKSVFKNSNYISDNVIRVIGYQSSTQSITVANKNYKSYKFFLNKRSSEKFRFKDTFYIKGLKIKDSSKVLDFFDTKFKIGPWLDYQDSYSNINGFYKKSIEYSAFLSTPLDNKLFRSDYSIDIFLCTNDFDSNTNFDFEVDFSNAFILNSDFESGVFENSNWNSGYHFNYNSDNNITAENEYIYNTESPIHTISLSGSSNNNLIIDTRSKFTETELDYYNKDEVIFLNNITYDTSGSVLDLIITNQGSGYTSSNDVIVSGLYGINLTIDYYTDSIGGVVTASLITNGGSYNPGSTYGVIGGSGSNLVFLVNDSAATDVLIVNPGVGYEPGNIIFIDGIGFQAQYIIDEVTYGSILSVTISSPGVGYVVDEILTIPGGLSSSTLVVDNTGGTKLRLPDSYKVISDNSSPIILTTVDDSNIGITQSHGIFITSDAHNRYNYLHKVKFLKSKIVSGIFRRSYFENCLIKNSSYDVTDRDFTNIARIKELVITDSIFKGNKNILSNALYMNSTFVENGENRTLNDIWDNGILFNSIWNGLIFNNGLVKESTWIDGDFINGLFYNSRSFDNNYTDEYNNNRISSYYKSGIVSDVIFNNRYSWQKGSFKGGEFYKSDWEGGRFINGKFYYSKFYSGVIDGGIIGDKSISDTFIYNGLVNYTTVENAKVYSNNNTQTITWLDGIFNNGLFGASLTSNPATWEGGIFNGGQFVDNSIWKNGTFNDGRFISTYKYLEYISGFSLPIEDNYSWKNGIFNGGEFGNGSTSSNSTWWNGEFNNGIFKGKEWYNGVFLYGEFNGSGLLATGGLTCSNAVDFTNSFTNINRDFYGLWRNGFFTDIKDKFIDKEQFTDIKRATESSSIKRSIMKNALWVSGIFSHPGGEVENSVWLDGTFENGTFKRSSFNPFVLNSISNNITSQFNINDSCIWKNGRLLDSEFYISKWLNGNFISGTAVGMLWSNGVVNYMNAYNIQWEDGIWKNGNWNGSYFTIPEDGIIIDDYTKQILSRGASASGTASCHVWNLFYQDDLSNVNNSSSSTSDELSSISVSDTAPTAPTEFNAG